MSGLPGEVLATAPASFFLDAEDSGVVRKVKKSSTRTVTSSVTGGGGEVRVPMPDVQHGRAQVLRTARWGKTHYKNILR